MEYYTLGENKWKTADAWPPENGKVMRIDLKGERDSYIYDPDNPATHIIDMSENEIGVPEDYTQEEKREDFLLFSSEPFQEPVTVTGDVVAHLFVSCDCPDTDLVLRMTDVRTESLSNLPTGLWGSNTGTGSRRHSIWSPEKCMR